VLAALRRRAVDTLIVSDALDERMEVDGWPMGGWLAANAEGFGVRALAMVAAAPPDEAGSSDIGVARFNALGGVGALLRKPTAGWRPTPPGGGAGSPSAAEVLEVGWID